jgi:hypothetical protein
MPRDSPIIPCWRCGHADCRDASHARGCPKLPPLTQERLLELAREVEDGWLRGRDRTSPVESHR